ncbi:MAG TPA: class I SAM-dependent methyltransferase [Chloroflexia bacterium]|nr:class I SAM-dependent methyltransferase [Chloroflexia bacterium]
MRQDLYEDLYVKEQDYWWHVGKRTLVYTLLDRYLKPGEKGRRRALDLGCGTGLNLDHMARYARPVGTDFSEEALHFCRERGHELLCKADAASLPFPDQEFDIITALDVIEHLDDDLLALSELKRVLKPGGFLIVSVPAYEALWTYWDDILGHRRRYTTNRMRGVVRRAGFRVRKTSYSNLAILLPVVLVRLLKSVLVRAGEARGSGKDPETDFMPVPGWLNRLLITYYNLEARLLVRRSLPFGLSVICVAQRPHSSNERK